MVDSGRFPVEGTECGLRAEAEHHVVFIEVPESEMQQKNATRGPLCA